MSVSTEQVRAALLRIADMLEENKHYLTELDAAIGDGDHGLNMARGFGIAKEKLSGGDGATVSDLLKTTAMALISNVGGAAGPLYGTLFLKASGAVKDKAEVDLADFAAMLAEGIEGVKMRGKATLGEKTMLDVQIPVLGSLEADVAAGTPGPEALQKAAAVARERAEATKDVLATKGRASYLGERSIGHIDPGAMSSCMMLETLVESLGGA